MKRHLSLRPLSREHHHVLAHARAIRWALSGREGTPRGALDAFLGGWTSMILPHFAEEEAWILPLVPRPEDAERLCREHGDLRALVGRLAGLERGADPDPSSLAELARALDDHIRWEERELFPSIEQGATEEQLLDVGRRLAVRPS
jgi:hypothetical protein